MDKNPNIVVLGGGTGSFTVLSSLRDFDVHLTSIVSMADDGSSTGILRDELGALPPGDVRQCLVALSEAPIIRDLFDYRFDQGSLGGHSFGNLFLTALEKTSGDFATAVERASEILRIKGRVLPATLDDVRLVMSWPSSRLELKGERVIDNEHFRLDPRKAKLELTPEAEVNPQARQAILAADIVVIAPGDLYTSLGALLAIEGIDSALCETSARIIYVCNLVTKHGQTDGFSVEDHLNEIERFIDGEVVDVVLYNTGRPDAETTKRYDAESAFMVQRDLREPRFGITFVGEDLLGEMAKHKAADKLIEPRSLIRHDQVKLAAAILTIGGV